MDYAFKLLKSFVPHKINDMSLVNAALRPSGASYRDRLLAHEINHNPSEIIDDLLKDNFGYLVFQEDTIAFLQKICGLTGSEADNIRRAIGRKQKDRLDKAMPSILEGYCTKSPKPRDVAEKEAKEFLQIIEDSSNYQFGFNHSTGYSMIGYTCAYMRYYYPHEFIAAYLNNANNEDDIKNGTNLAQIKGIKILPPKFRHSKDIYQPDKSSNSIYKGLASIKFMNGDVANKLYEMREEKFDSFINVIERFPGNSRQLDILIRLNFFEEFGKSLRLIKIVELYDKLHGKKILKKDKIGTISEDLIRQYATETEKQFKITDSNALLSALCDLIPDESLPLNAQIKAQTEYLGYIDLHSNVPNTAIVLNVDTKYSPKATCYDLCTQEMFVAKISKKYYAVNPVNTTQMISYRTEKKNGWKKNDKGEWEQDPNKIDTWLVSYNVV